MNAIDAGVWEIDIHGMNAYQARVLIDSRLRRAGRDVYRLRIIHGCHHGTILRDMIAETYAHHRRVLRMETGRNGGVTELILREWY